MQITKIPDLTGQILAIKKKQEDWASLRSVIHKHKIDLEKRLNKLPEHDDVLRNAIHSCDSMISEFDNLEQSSQNYIGVLGKERDQLTQVLRSKQWFVQALGISEETRKMWYELDYVSKNELAARISTVMEWQHPVLIVNVSNKDILSAVTHLTQVYLADTDDNLLNEAKSNFEVGYAESNLRCYNIKDYNSLDLSELPQEQFGTVICWYIFERLTMPLIEEALFKFEKLLKPGGTFIFNINNCDTELGARFAVDPPVKSFVTKELLESAVAKTKFTLFSWHDYSPTNTMVELKMPGKLTSFKRKQGKGTIGRYS
jgi:hypothetical protein